MSADRVQKLRVAVVAPSLKFLGGQAIQAQRLLDGWRRDADIEAWLVPHDPTLPKTLRFAQDVKYLRTVATELTYLPALLREIARADVVHAFSASYWSFLLSPMPAVLVARALGRPVVLHYHSGEAPDHLRRSAIARSVLAHTTRNVVPSRYLVGVFQSFGLNADVIPNMIDLDRFRFRVRDPLKPRFLSTRNFEPLYNVACTLRAFGHIQRRLPDATLTLVGGGSQETVLRSMAARLQLRNVTFAGRVHPDAIATYYDTHDVYLQSPAIDNAPVSLLEAFASGLPVVSTEAGGVPALITNGVNGLLAPVDDHESLAAQAVRLFDDPHSVRPMTRAARERCANCTWASIREQWLRVYRELHATCGRSHEVLKPSESA